CGESGDGPPVGFHLGGAGIGMEACDVLKGDRLDFGAGGDSGISARPINLNVEQKAKLIGPLRERGGVLTFGYWGGRWVAPT
ncbi:hypothetical protein, partial [Glaciihabitans tibetensis]|uniref:hypothetical protein n=1 Tax=Glaciihabitans tibetensis TaxID=1266600 RepID=UPI001C62900A